MPKRYSSAHIIQVLMRHGFVLVNQTGSHQKFRKSEQVVIVPVPKKEMPQGTFLSASSQTFEARFRVLMRRFWIRPGG